MDRFILYDTGDGYLCMTENSDWLDYRAQQENSRRIAKFPVLLFLEFSGILDFVFFPRWSQKSFPYAWVNEREKQLKQQKRLHPCLIYLKPKLQASDVYSQKNKRKPLPDQERLENQDAKRHQALKLDYSLLCELRREVYNRLSETKNLNCAELSVILEVLQAAGNREK